MNKVFLYLFVFLFAISFVFAAGENAVLMSAGNSEDIESNGSQNQVAVQTMNQGESSQLRVETSSEFGTTLKSQDGKSEAKTSMSLNQDGTGKTFTTLSNGMNAEIKVMPDSASEKALEVLSAKCEETGCEIELKEVGKGNETKAAYEVKAKKEVKVLGFINAQMRTQAQIDAGTGEVVKTRNSWWGFLAKKNLEE